jgi:hypothetical protein
MAFIQVVKPKIKNNNAIIIIDSTVFRVDNDSVFTTSIFFFIISGLLFIRLLFFQSHFERCGCYVIFCQCIWNLPLWHIPVYKIT